MKIVFMGTPDFARESLRQLLQTKHEILAVYTQPDRPSGRGNKLSPSAVKELAVEAGIPVYQPEKARSPEVVAELAALNPDVIIVVAYGQILPQAILDIPKFGCLNVHGSILPQYRGAAPIHWAVLNGDKETGVTIMKMDVGMDTGDVLSIAYEPISDDDTTAILYERLKVLGAKLLVDTLPKLEMGLITPIKQDDAQATYTKLIKRDMEKIDISDSAVHIHNKVRAISGAFILNAEGVPVKVWKTELSELNCECKAGEVFRIDKRGIIIATGDGCLKILEIQPANRKRMSAVDFANGNKLTAGYMFS